MIAFGVLKKKRKKKQTELSGSGIKEVKNLLNTPGA